MDIAEQTTATINHSATPHLLLLHILELLFCKYYLIVWVCGILWWRLW